MNAHPISAIRLTGRVQGLFKFVQVHSRIITCYLTIAKNALLVANYAAQVTYYDLSRASYDLPVAIIGVAVANVSSLVRKFNSSI